jgi:glycosyltransferase involved in cell wall biosynthesis
MGKVIFLTSGSQLNSAPFNRFIAIVKATKMAGYQTEVIYTKPFKNASKVPLSGGGSSFVYDDVLFKNVNAASRNRKSIPTRVLLRVKTYYHAIQLLRKQLDKKHSIIYILSLSLFENILFYLVARIYRVPYVRERSEFPLLIRSPKKIQTKIYKVFVLPWCYKLFDGMVIMTTPLIEFYSRYTRRKCHIVRVPMSVDSSRFELPDVPREKYIGYVGSLDCKKDGVDTLILAFARIQKEFPEVDLKIAGAPDRKEQEAYLMELSARNEIEKKVHLLGGKKREEIPQFLCAASLLILARPASKQAEGGFPTKLGEYLATGNPVIVSDVGEISNYLRKDIDAYVIEPGNIDDLSETMKKALGNPSEASRIGKNGKKVVARYFDYKSQSVLLGDFYQGLISL